MTRLRIVQMAEQLVLDLPVETAFGRDDFFVTEANRVAVAAVDDWHDWPFGKLILTGPAGAGKTHMAQIWAQSSGASVVQARALAAADVEALASGAVVVEDVHLVAGHPEAQTSLFHLHNRLAEAGAPLLLTGCGVVSGWDIALADLASRLAAANVVEIGAPDDGLLAAVMVKQFFDRQIEVEPDVIRYVLARMDRSFAAAHMLVATLDKMSLREQRPVGPRMAARALAAMDVESG